MVRDYWDVDQILQLESPVEARFLKSAPGLGHLDPLRGPTQGSDLPAGSVLSFPLWIVAPMTQLGLVMPIMPDDYSENMQNVLRKAPEGARLGEKSKNYFSVGLWLCWLIGEREDLAAAIFVASTQRIRHIIDRSALSMRNEERESEFLHLFTDNEAKIYMAGTESNEKYDLWRHNHLNRLNPRPELVPLLQEPVTEN
jgi:hypothetical protein